MPEKEKSLSKYFWTPKAMLPGNTVPVERLPISSLAKMETSKVGRWAIRI